MKTLCSSCEYFDYNEEDDICECALKHDDCVGWNTEACEDHDPNHC